MSDKPNMREQIASVLTRVVQQAQPYHYLFQRTCGGITLIEMAVNEDRDYVGIRLTDHPFGDSLVLKYDTKNRKEDTAMPPERIGELIEISRYVDPSLLPKFLGDITTNFIRGIVDAEFCYREQTSFAQQRKELEERLKAAVFPRY